MYKLTDSEVFFYCITYIIDIKQHIAIFDLL